MFRKLIRIRKPNILKMSVHKFGICFFVISMTYFSMNLNGQIYGPLADFAKKLTYNTYSGDDSVFIFYSTADLPEKGSLTAIPTVPGNYNFEWSKYNPSINGFDPVFLVQSGLPQSVAGNLDEGGYKVRIFNGVGVDVSFTAWVYLNELRAEAEKDDQGNLKPFKYTCFLIQLNGFVFIDTFYYYDFSTHEKLLLQNDYTFRWTSDNPDLNIPFANIYEDPQIISHFPTIDTRFLFTVTDSFMMQVSDDVFYKTIHVDAKFRIMIFDKEETKLYIDPSDPYEGGAPLKVRFINESQNGNSFEWIFSDSVRSGLFSNEFTTDVNYEPEYSYYIPGFPQDYYPALVAWSMEGCTDTFTIDQPIIVLPSELEIPNVFSPDGDGINRYFKVEHQSIEEFSIIIMNRWGKVVYRAETGDLYEWEGWDGKVLNTNQPASPGAYFYIIEARGYDSKRYYRNQYKGTVYLFRGDY